MCKILDAQGFETAGEQGLFCVEFVCSLYVRRALLCYTADPKLHQFISLCICIHLYKVEMTIKFTMTLT